MIPTIANIRKAIYCLNKRIDQLEGRDYSNTVIQLSNKVATLESLLDDTQNPTAAIDKFNEIVAFLDSIDNTETLQKLLKETVSVAQLEKLEDNVVMTGSYDATVAVGLADNLRGDAIVSAEFYKRKTGGTQSVGSGIAAIKEMRGKSIVWNQLVDANTIEVATISGRKYLTKINDVKSIITSTGAAITVNDASVDQVFDITLMFGTSNEPATVEEFEKIFPLDYYDYNAGEVIPFAGQNLVTTGKNQYNPTSGKANLIGGKQYQIKGTYTKIYPTVTLVDYTYGSPVVSGTYYTNANSHYVGNVDIAAYDNTKTYALGSYCINGGSIYKSNVAIDTAEEFDSTKWDVVADVAAMVIEGIFTLWDITPDANGLFTLTKNTEVTIVGGNDTNTMIAIYDGENVSYEPYEKHTLPLDPSQWRDKQGNLVFPYGGMHGVGTTYDYAKVDADGYIRRAITVYGGIDVGDYDYTKQGNLYTTSGFIPPKPNMLFGKGRGVVWNQILPIPASNKSVTQNGVTFTDNRDGSYTIQTIQEGATASVSIWLGNISKTNDKKYVSKGSTVPISIGWGGNGKYVKSNEKSKIIQGTQGSFGFVINSGTIIASPITFSPIVSDLTLMFGAGNEPATIEEFKAMFPLDYYNYDSGSLGLLPYATFANATTFKSAMQGVSLIYELAEPIEVELATPIYAKYLVDKDGTEEITPANGVKPYTTMANLSILYAMDAKGEIKNLPKNYLSKESAENMLNAMVSAGVIASYTITWDAANNRYAFVITAPVEPEPTPEQEENNN